MTDNIERLVSKLTLEEKACLCSGLDNWHTKPVERLDIPSIMVADGPHGLRKEQPADGVSAFASSYPATCFPTASALACSWNRDLLFEIGEALAEECLQEGISVILGPGVNIKRSPLCGRNFEYFSEDPYLAGEMAARHIQGVQSKEIGTSLKHFAANNQEYRRMSINALVDERALREIYLPAFEKAVKQSQPWTVMCAYNRLNGTYCSENKWLLKDVLREEWGFRGIVMSDWGAVNQRVWALSAGLELEMPGGNHENDGKLVTAVKNHELDNEVLDESVARLLELVENSTRNKREGFHYNIDQHHALARKAASECIVLLKNEDNILPLQPTQKIAVIGDFAKIPRYQGYGSSLINPTRLDNAYDEMVKIAGENGQISYAGGFVRDSEKADRKLVKTACDAARQAQVVVLFLGLPELAETEGIDREHLRLPYNQNELVRSLLAINPNLVVVLSNGAPVEMPWAKDVKAILEGYLAGQAGGGALADVLFGIVNPSGKLAETFPHKLEDNPSFENFPGGPQTVQYRESIFVGYRYYDKIEQEVLFPFGHGLSYTSFAYQDLKINKTHIAASEKVNVSCTVRNAGQRTGREIVQLYVGPAESGFFAPHELKSFEKVELAPGQAKRVTFQLDERSFAFYDVQKKGWRIAPGEYKILIGASSRDFRLSGTVMVGDGREYKADNDQAWSVYASLLDNHFAEADFQALYGSPLPENRVPHCNEITLNTSLLDFRRTLLGRLVVAILKREFKKQSAPGDSALHKRMVEKIMLEIPLQNLTNLSDGYLTEPTARALVQLANGRLLAALRTLKSK